MNTHLYVVVKILFPCFDVYGRRDPEKEFTKTLRYGTKAPVGQVLKDIRETIQGVGGRNHGLFKPKDIETGEKGKWLEPQYPLSYYGIKNNTQLEYKKIRMPLKIQLADGTTKHVMVDTNRTVREIADQIGEKLNLGSADEYSLMLPIEVGMEKAPKWLQEQSTLYDQNLDPSIHFWYAKRYHYHDHYIEHDPFSLHLLYMDVKQAVLNGKYPVGRGDIVTLTALFLQISFGDYKGQEEKVILKENLPKKFKKDKRIAGEIITEWKKFVKMADGNAKYRYVQVVRSLKSYGLTYFSGQLSLKKNPEYIQIGVARDFILIENEETGSQIKKWPWTQIQRYYYKLKQGDKNLFVLDPGDFDELFKFYTREVEALKQIIDGYIELHLKTYVDLHRVVEANDFHEGAEEEIGHSWDIPIYSLIYPTSSRMSLMANEPDKVFTSQPQRAMLMPVNITPEVDANYPTPKNNKKVVTHVIRLSEEELGRQFYQKRTLLFAQVDKFLKQRVIDKQFLQTAQKLTSVGMNLMCYDPSYAPLCAGAKLIAKAIPSIPVDDVESENLDPPEEQRVDLPETVLKAIDRQLEVGKEMLEHATVVPFMVGSMESDRNDIKNIEFPPVANLQSVNALPVKITDPNTSYIIEQTTEVLTQLALLPEKDNEMIQTISKCLPKVSPTYQRQLGEIRDGWEAVGHNIHSVLVLAPFALDPKFHSLFEEEVNLVCNQLERMEKKIVIPGQEMEQEAMKRISNIVVQSLYHLTNTLSTAEKQNFPPQAQEFHTLILEILNTTPEIRRNLENPENFQISSNSVILRGQQLLDVAVVVEKYLPPEMEGQLRTWMGMVMADFNAIAYHTNTVLKFPGLLESRGKVLAAVAELDEHLRLIVGEIGKKTVLDTLRSDVRRIPIPTLSLLNDLSSVNLNDIPDQKLRHAMAIIVKKVNNCMPLLADALLTVTPLNHDDFNAHKELIKTVEATLPQLSELILMAKTIIPTIPSPPLQKKIIFATSQVSRHLSFLQSTIQQVARVQGEIAVAPALPHFDPIKFRLDQLQHSIVTMDPRVPGPGSGTPPPPSTLRGAGEGEVGAVVGGCYS